MKRQYARRCRRGNAPSAWPESRSGHPGLAAALPTSGRAARRGTGEILRPFHPRADLDTRTNLSPNCGGLRGALEDNRLRSADAIGRIAGHNYHRDARCRAGARTNPALVGAVKRTRRHALRGRVTDDILDEESERFRSATSIYSDLFRTVIAVAWCVHAADRRAACIFGLLNRACNNVQCAGVGGLVEGKRGRPSADPIRTFNRPNAGEAIVPRPARTAAIGLSLRMISAQDVSGRHPNVLDARRPSQGR